MLHANVRIRTGSYTGTGAYKTITGLGFRPQFVFVMSSNSQHCVWKIAQMLDTNSIYFGSSAVDITNGTAILGFTNDGFTVGTGTIVNQSAIDFYWLAIGGTAQTISTGSYVGTGADNRNVTDTQKVSFIPYFTLLGADAVAGRIYRCRGFHTGDSSVLVGSGANLANGIQDQIANGFQVGSGSTVNTSGTVYKYFSLAELPLSCMKAGTYTGTGAQQTINGVGFRPDFLMIKSTGTTAGSETQTLYTSSMPTGNARRSSAVGINTNRVDSTHLDGFTVGTDAGVSELGDTFTYFALKSGDYNSGIDRTAI